MKIVFFGEDSFSQIVLQTLLSNRIEVLAVVSPLYNNNIHKRLEYTSEINEIPYFRISNLETPWLINLVKKLAPDLIVVTHFEKIIPESLFTIPRMGAINLHPSLLPRYRGLAPQHWPIINGDAVTGITVHYIDKGIDTGDIILQITLPVHPEMYVSDLQQQFYRKYPDVILEAIRLIQNNSVKPVKMSPEAGSYYGKLKKEDCRIFLTKTRSEILNLIKGVSLPYFGAFINDTIIWRARLANDEENQDILKDYDQNGVYDSSKYGKILRLMDGGLIIEKYSKIE